MKIRRWIALGLLALVAPAMAQDAKTVIANASKAMGLDGVNSLYYYGTGRTYSIGQNNNANIPWPQTPLNDWVRAIDFAQPAMRTTWSTYAVPVTGGAARLVLPEVVQQQPPRVFPTAAAVARPPPPVP